MKIIAKWIWLSHQNKNAYNQTVVAQRVFGLKKNIEQAQVLITADSFYRLYINDIWVNDGPCRSWPESYQYDAIDISSYLKCGDNEVKIIARYYGVGDMHRIPQHPGLLAQFDIKLTDGSTKIIITDEAWEIAEAKTWISNTPKIGIQMEPVEYYDARKEDAIYYSKAEVLFDTDKGPWQNLNKRDVVLMTKKPFSLKSFISANIIKRNGVCFCLPAARLVHPGLIEANNNTSMPCGMAAILKNEQVLELSLSTEGFKFSVDGIINNQNKYNLQPGRHLVLVFSDRLLDHHGKEKTFHFSNRKDFEMENPLDSAQKNPWVYIEFKEYAFAENDLKWKQYFTDNPQIQKLMSDYATLTDNLLEKITGKQTLLSELPNRTKVLSYDEMFVHDFHKEFENRKVIKNADNFVESPVSAMSDNSEYTTVNPCLEGDIELAYDLGEENCGYYQFALSAEDGVIIDINSVEHISDAGQVQHPPCNRNGMRYITKKGINCFTSLKRRAGRYIFLTLRNVYSPIKIYNVKLIESTYPVDYKGFFICSDQKLNKIWDISARTLKLCMEDVFTDCPLYEQTLWVGDLRNEALFAYPTFGAYDLAKRSIKLAAESLGRYPIIGAQVPSSWDCLLPAWSFLWGISVWEYYWYTGDEPFLRQMWDYTIKNLKGAESLINERGLFSGPFWNMFDWTGIDDEHKTVMHNSMLLVGAIDAALKCADVIEDENHKLWLTKFRNDLCKSINCLWDSHHGVYPDSVHDDGTVSKSVCQHTSFISLLYDIVEEDNVKSVISNMLKPPANMVQVGSPFAMMYLYESLEKAGFADDIITSIYAKYQIMLDAGATTVWESFPSGKVSDEMSKNGFNVRSRCHGWSAAPLYFLTRIILGIKQLEPGAAAFEISPRLNALSWAKGTIATIHGPITVAWEVKGKTFDVSYSAPKGIKINVIENDTTKGLKLNIGKI